jgi:hypothetical protein
MGFCLVKLPNGDPPAQRGGAGAYRPAPYAQGIMPYGYGGAYGYGAAFAPAWGWPFGWFGRGFAGGWGRGFGRRRGRGRGRW